MKALILGAGISGLAAADFLFKRGYHVTILDKTPPKGIKKYWVFPDSMHIEHFTFDLMVVSPGIPRTHPLYTRAVEAGIEVIGEAELAFRYIKQPIIGVTGTNGKTTLVRFLEHVLNHSGRSAIALGNIGTPFLAGLPTLKQDQIVIAELSSFQLETLTTKALDTAVILCITPHHLERYRDFEEYAKTKGKIVELLKQPGLAFVDEKSLEHLPPEVPVKLFESQRLEDRAAQILEHYGVTRDEVAAAAKTFSPPSLRIELVHEANGVSYYNDSKSTNHEALFYATTRIAKPLILIAGGKCSGGSYSEWQYRLKNVKRLILVGEAGPKIYQENRKKFDCELANNLEEAIMKAESSAVAGDAILFSPGCTSFDAYRNFEERGRHFNTLVGQNHET